MKLFLLTCLVCFSILSFAQAPQQISYQGVARHSAGTVLVNQSIGVEFKIHQGSIGGTVIFTEAHTISTNAFGLFTLGIGSVNTSGFSAVNWANGPFFLEIFIDPTGGTSYSSVGTQQLMSVPFALYAQSAGNVTPTPTITINSPNTISTPSAGNYALSVVSQSLSISSNSLSITNGNTVSLPVATVYTAGTGISITSGSVITNTAPNQTVTITGTGIATATNSSPNYTVNVPSPVMSFNNATGTYSYTQGTYTTALSLLPSSSFNQGAGSGILSIGSSTMTIPGTGILSRSGSTVTLANATDNVGVGTTTPAEKLVVSGNIAIPAANQYKYLTPKTRYYSMSALSFNTEGAYNRQNVGGGIYITGGTTGAQGNFYAGVNLPDGAVVTGMDAYVLDNDGTTGYDFPYIQLWRQDGQVGSAYGNAVNMGSTPGTTITSSVITKLSTVTFSNATIDNSNYTYYVRVASVQNVTNLMLFKVVITYTITGVE